jgi:isoquinoline 1-oxidoreductase beta subunit
MAALGVRRDKAALSIWFLAHAAMEPLSCVADVGADACEVWTATQVQARAQGIAAQVSGLPAEK